MKLHYDRCYAGAVSSTRARALDAAIALLADEGVRALTHRRVDDRAGLPRGSTSNSFRTRAALLVGVARHMTDRESPAVAAGFAAGTVDELVDALVEIYRFLTGPNRSMTAARLALFVEAGHDDDVRRALSDGRAALDRILLPALARLGAQDPALAAERIAVCFEGLFLHDLGRRADIDPRPHLEATVRAGIGGDDRRG